MPLSDEELWERVRRLESRIVYTLKRRNPNRISGVTSDSIEIEGRVTRPSREDILCVYHHLQRTVRLQERIYMVMHQYLEMHLLKRQDVL